MAKRSPILGYNHNVRYRGLVFHVQTEDSGLLNPHLFTHLFHEGVIVSTRKLVYDAGANEEAVKALMQAQHKAVMKDLRKGAFDDKIDQYLSDKPGLEPRASGAARARSEPRPNDSGASPIEIVHEGLSEPIELPVKRADAVPAKSRTGTGDRTIPVSSLPPSPSELDSPTDRTGGEMAAAIQQANASSTPQPTQSRTTTAQRVSRTQADIARAPTQLAPNAGFDVRESAPVIEISVDDDEPSDRVRGVRDTEVEALLDDASVPRNIEAAVTTPHRPGRPASHGAATLPAKPPSRPIAPPVVTRPPTQDRKRPDSDVIEVYSPPPASAEPPPGERAERPGQYSMSRKEGAAIREKTGRPDGVSSAPGTVPPARPRPPSAAGSPVAQPPSTQRPLPPTRGAQPPPTPRAATPSAGMRVPPPANRVHTTAPITNRAPSPATPASGSGVVMTRPAVIVGAPPKPATQTQRVRKAREDEGRGFGQGLISEKSLDEVILAYLSEDAEDK